MKHHVVHRTVYTWLPLCAGHLKEFETWQMLAGTEGDREISGARCAVNMCYATGTVRSLLFFKVYNPDAVSRYPFAELLLNLRTE